MADKRLCDDARRKRFVIREMCQQLCKNITDECNRTDIINVVAVEAKRNALQKREQELTELNKDIEKYEEHDEYLDNLRGELEEIEKIQLVIEEALAFSKMVIEVVKQGNSCADKASVKSKAVKLLVLKPPVFSGEATEYVQFIQAFETSVDAQDELSDGQKLQYLMDMLKGEALKVVSSLPHTAASYKTARDWLNETFGNPKTVVNAHVDSLMKLTPVRNSSNMGAVAELYRTLDFHVRALKELKDGYEEFNKAFFNTVQKMLPKDMILAFHKQGLPNEVSEIVEFLREEVSCWRKSGLLMVGSGQDEAKEKVREKLLIKTASALMIGEEDSSNEQSVMTTAINKSTSEETTNRVPRVFCLLCNNTDHWVDACTVKRTWAEKKRLLIQKGRCFRCGQRDHLARECQNPRANCKICKGKHITALCNEFKKISSGEGGEKVAQEEVGAFSVQAENKSKDVMLLQMAHVFIPSDDGMRAKDVRLLLDNGSQGSFIKKELVEELNLKIIGSEEVKLNTFGGESKLQSCNKVLVPILNHSKERVCIIQALAIEKLSVQSMPYPCESLITQCKTLGLELADRPLNVSGESTAEIELLIGVDYYWDIVLGGHTKLSENLVATSTKVGYILQGHMRATVLNPRRDTQVMFVGRVCTDEVKLDNLWTLDAVGLDSKQEIDEHSQKVKVDWTGERYEVQLPWLMGKKDLLTSNQNEALARCHQLLRSLKKTPGKLEAYHQGVYNYVKNGHARVVTGPSMAKYLMPHFAVVRQGTTTDLRVVFDASSKTEGGVSLNDCLSQGNNRWLDVVKILLRIGKGAYAYVSDLEKAFLQISIKEDRQYLRFLWLPENFDKENLDEIIELEMLRVTFGVTSSPYLLREVLMFHLQKYRQEEPQLVVDCEKNSYVDDIVASVENEQQLIQEQQKLQKMFREEGFNIRKWLTNSDIVRQQWKENQVQTAESELVKVMGMNWDAISDQLSDILPKSVLSKAVECTKRNISVSVASIFDPLGLLPLVIIPGKLLIQKCWLKGLDWDDQTDEDLTLEWEAWRTAVMDLEAVTIPRRQSINNCIRVELHCFSDASMVAYGAVLYLRQIDENGDVKIAFLLSRYRIAPLKKRSLPQLELLAATMSARLSHYWKQTTELKIDSVFYWVDSLITLWWIRNDQKRRDLFVQNRVADIRKWSLPIEWRHCPSGLNIADGPTRVTRMKHDEIIAWIDGPKWLNDMSDWPVNDEVKIDENTYAINLISTPSKKKVEGWVTAEHFGSWTKLVRATGWWIRFLRFKRKIKGELRVGALTLDELREAENYWFAVSQKRCFGEEWQAIDKGKAVERKSKLRKFKFIIDENYLLRLYSRIDSLFYSVEQRFPIVLDGCDVVTQLIIKCYHEQYLHAGVSVVMANLRNRFWIFNVRRVCQKIVKECGVCFKAKTEAYKAPTGNLIEAQTDLGMAFDKVGLDFAGPVAIKGSEKHSRKGYILMLTCLATRAVHLEVTTNLTTERFMLAFQRFLARRGQPNQIHSDNGATFKKAEKLLKKIVIEGLKSPRFAFFKLGPLRWSFNVERAPWMGGAWERLIGVLKVILRKVLGRAFLDYEEFSTLLCTIECIINSHPLTYISGKESDFIPLTPNLLITGKAFAAFLFTMLMRHCQC